MNKTKRLTTGAMLLAIIGAFMIIDRQLSYIFTTYIVLLIPVVIAAYSTMYKLSDGLMLCIGLLAFTVLFGSLTTYIYMPISIIVGMVVSLAISKNMDRRKITLITIIVYILAEVLVAYIVKPIIGVSVVSQIDSYTEAFNEMVKYTESAGLGSSISTAISDVSSFIMVVFVSTIILTGFLEGFLTSLLTAFVLKRFKIKEIGLNSPLDIKMPLPVAYGLMIVTCLYMFVGYINNETLKYAVLCLSVIASFALVYYGYFFVILYLRKTGSKINILLVVLAIVLLFPLSYIILIVVGFLYGSGPLRRIIEN